AILVAGGFHSDGLAKLLGRENVTLITVSPKLSKVDRTKDNEYLSVFTREKTPLERLFEAPKISIVMNLASAAIQEPSGLSVNPQASFFKALIEPLRTVVRQ